MLSDVGHGATQDILHADTHKIEGLALPGLV